MRIDRYVHDERLTWGAAAVLLVVATTHAAGIGRLFTTPPTVTLAEATPIFQVSLERLPPPRLPPQLQRDSEESAPPTPEAPQPRPRQTRPVPILVDTPTADPVPIGTAVKPYEIGDELLPGVPGPAVLDGVPDGDTFDAAPVERTPVYWRLKPLEMKPPVYPPRCLRLQIEGRVDVRVLVGEDGRPQEVALGQSSGDASLDEAALDAVRGWRFEPARINGVAVRAWAAVPIDFRLID